jgi:hypothetical protein
MGKQELLRTAVVWRVGEATRSGIPVYREAMGSAKIAPHKVAAESRENRDRPVFREMNTQFPLSSNQSPVTRNFVSIFAKFNARGHL